MSRAGLSFRQILASLTTAPATQFGDSERLGRIARVGPDLVVLIGDPSRTLKLCCRSVYGARCKVIYRARP